MKIRNYVDIKKIPELESLPKYPEPLLGQISKKKGNIIFLHNGSEIRYISIIEFNEGFGPRGNHYHTHKHEYIYVLSGKGKVQLWMPKNPTENIVCLVEKGDLIYVKPGCAHAYTAIEKMLVIEFSPQVFDINDGYDVNNLDDILGGEGVSI